MQEVEFVWMDGNFVKWDNANIHILTPSLHYGSSVFEGIRCYYTAKGPAVFRLKDHIRRFFASAKAIGLEISFSEKELFDACLELVRMNKLKECYIRPIAYYGYGQMGINPIGSPTKVAIIVWPWDAYLGEDAIKNGVRVKVSPWVRPPINVLPAGVKASANYLNSMLAKLDAINSGYEDAVLLDSAGNVAECTVENIYIVNDGVIITPPIDNILKGITRESIIQIALDFDLKVEERFFGKEKLISADECFMTGTAIELTPIKEIDGKPIGNGKPGPITTKLQARFYEAIHGKILKYEKWLDFVN